MKNSEIKFSESKIIYEEPSVDTEFYFQWHITEQCNCRCHHCYHTSYDSANELSDQLLLKVVDVIEAAIKEWDRRGAVSLTGGEPWLRRHSVLALLDRFASGGLVDRVDLLTNGLLLSDSDCEELTRKSLLRRVQVSLDGATAESHDGIRGKGSFHKTLAAISRMKHHGLTVSIMMTISQHNVNDIIPLLDLLHEYNVDLFSVERFIPEGQAADQKSWILTPEQLKKAFHSVYKWAQGHDRPKVLMYRPLFCLVNDQSPHVGAMCSVGINALCIIHDGTIYPCRRLPIPLGNILTDSLYDIWYASPILWKIREPSNLKGRCSNCKFIPICRGCRAMALSFCGDWLGGDPQCWIESPNILA